MADLIGTREAARLLGVSEASVRRWSDAGLLASRRVGRRGGRRFERSAVMGLMPAGSRGRSGSPVVAVLEGHELPAHTHLSAFYTGESGRFRLAVPFLRDGILAGQGCILMAKPGTARGYESQLRAEGIDIDRAVDSGTFQVLAPFRSIEEGLEAFERAFTAITRRGGVLIRLLGEATENRDSLRSLAGLLRFEVQLDLLLHRFPVITVCQYDARRLAGENVVSVLKTHADNFDQPLGMFLN
jgi:excisionase family DNA binding protein